MAIVLRPQICDVISPYVYLRASYLALFNLSPTTLRLYRVFILPVILYGARTYPTTREESGCVSPVVSAAYITRPGGPAFLKKRFSDQPLLSSPVYTIQPVVKPVVKPVWQPGKCLYTRYSRCDAVWQQVVSCIQTFIRLSNPFDNWFDNRLYRVNGALARDHTALPATHTFIHTCLYSPAAQRHRALAGTHFPCRRVPRQTYCYLPGRKALPMGFCCGFFDGLELPSGPLLFIWFQHWRNYTITENVSVGTLL